ncbi:MAG: hypothetical protein NG747_08440 [Candidatus Brocadia sp.]|nr:hypothetical protein [Candidatus Brocadia sp.]
MSQLSKTIPKNPELKPAEDFYRLRREGIGFLEQMGSSLWTDFNIHDPGITILEALCYALTDIAYRAGWDIKDLLAPEPNKSFPKQAFFTAREILTVNPWTRDDFRRLLIDLESVRNAWVFRNKCACDVSYYAWCEKDQLKPSYDPQLQHKEVKPQGLYDVLLELEADPELGDLNDQKVEYAAVVPDKDDKNHPVTMELRFPGRIIENSEEWVSFLRDDPSDFTVNLKRFGAKKTFDVFTDPSLKNDEERDEYIQRHWKGVFYLDLEIQYSTKSFTIENVTMRLVSDAAARQAATANGLKELFEKEKVGVGKSVIHGYRKKTKKAKDSIKAAKAVLQNHRNLDEDYCKIMVVGIEEVAVCADVEVKPDADIEWVQANIWFEIEKYFNPPVPFYTLQELMDAGEPVEEIFNGPALTSGFIRRKDLEAASLKSVLQVSDIINRLMDIDGVIAVNQLQLVKYDAEGNIVRGAASASWLLDISDQHQPRLYLNGSRFLFYKNGLPFRPRMDEARDTLIQLRGEAERPKVKSAPNDLLVPAGKYRNPDDYFPVQYSFPLTYGIGPDGLPLHASDERKAQAKQLKAYLMVFEHLLGNALAQLAHTADLFSLDNTVKRTYFVKEFREALIKGFDEIKNGLDKDAVEAIAETSQEFQERRNRFLDHIMARFGEQFGEYALLLTNLEGKQVALEQLIEDKITFLNAYPFISHNRAKALDYSRPVPFDYSEPEPDKQENQPGVKKRISRLLGFPDIVFAWTAVTDLGVNKFRLNFQLKEKGEVIWSGYLTIDADSEDEAKLLGYRVVIKRMSLSENYKIAKKVITNGPDKFVLRLIGSVTQAHGRYLKPFDTKADAEAMQDKLVAWSANERMIVVEHLLLRPKFPGDALYPVCADGTCKTCGDEDPYSFRLTFVMPGWIEPFKKNMEMRDFADRTIRQETPAHLLGKICWVNNYGFDEDPCDPVIGELAELLEAKRQTDEWERPSETDACKCAINIYTAFSKVFREWYEDKTLDYIHPDPLKKPLEKEFSIKVKPDDFSCTALLGPLWAEIQAKMVEHFQWVAFDGWQFNRFEDAWHKWLKANAEIDWMEERLRERVEAILAQNLEPISDPDKSTEDALCECAAAILAQYGMEFHAWLEANVIAGRTPDEFTPEPEHEIALCKDFTFKNNTVEAIKKLLENRYSAYKEVSYRLRVVVDLLSRLSNIYDKATLHDCDEGNDQNPVRLGKTALGN